MISLGPGGTAFFFLSFFFLSLKLAPFFFRVCETNRLIHYLPMDPKTVISNINYMEKPDVLNLTQV